MVLTIMKTLQYPLGSTTFSLEKCNRLINLIYLEVFPKAKLCCNFLLDLSYENFSVVESKFIGIILYMVQRKYTTPRDVSQEVLLEDQHISLNYTISLIVITLRQKQSVMELKQFSKYNIPILNQSLASHISISLLPCIV